MYGFSFVGCYAFLLRFLFLELYRLEKSMDGGHFVFFSGAQNVIEIDPPRPNATKEKTLKCCVTYTPVMYIYTWLAEEQCVGTLYIGMYKRACTAQFDAWCTCMICCRAVYDTLARLNSHTGQRSA